MPRAKTKLAKKTKKVSKQEEHLTEEFELKKQLLSSQRDLEVLRHHNKMEEIKAEEEKERLFFERRKELMRIQMGMEKKRYLKKLQRSY